MLFPTGRPSTPGRFVTSGRDVNSTPLHSPPVLGGNLLEATCCVVSKATYCILVDTLEQMFAHYWFYLYRVIINSVNKQLAHQSCLVLSNVVVLRKKLS